MGERRPRLEPKVKVLVVAAIVALAALVPVAPASAATFTVTVNGGYGSGSYAPGSLVHVWSNVDPATSVALPWSGDDELLDAPDEWRTTFVMPARNVALTSTTAAQSLPLTVETFRGATSVAKTVRYRFPPSMRGLVLVSHGTFGDSRFIAEGDAYALSLSLVRAGYGVISFEAEEAVAGDLNGDGKPRWRTSYSTTNVDLRNTDLLLADFERRGLITSRTPRFALGMSNGGAWSHALGTVADTSVASSFPRLHFQAVISYCADASGTLSSAISTTPSAWYMCGADDNAEVSNAQAKANEARMRGRSVPTDYVENPPSPIYDARFARVPGVTVSESTAIVAELRAAGFISIDGFLDTDGDVVSAFIAAHPSQFPVAVAQNARRPLGAQLSVMRAEHQMYADLAARTVAWFDRFNRPPTADPQSLTVNKGVAKAFTLTGTDPDGGPLTCVVPGSTTQRKGTLGGSGCQRTFTASPRSSGSDAFAFRTRKGDGLQSPNTTVSLSIANRPPTATNQTVQVGRGQRVAIALTGTDPDPGEGFALTCSPTTGPTARGTVAGSGCHLTYAAGSTEGTDAVVFTVADGFGGTDAGVVTVQVVAPTLPGCADDDAATARYVCRVYLDLLGRPADAGGKAYWVAKLGGGEPRSTIIRRFQTTPEYARRVVDDVYRAFLQRVPDSSGQAYWAGKIQRGANPDEIRTQVLGSSEYLTKAGGSSLGFGAALHQQVTRLPGTAAQLQSVVDRIAVGATRTSVAATLLATSAGDRATVTATYGRFLRRAPSSAESSTWVSRLQAGTTEIRLVEALVSSAEYLALA